MPGSHPTQRVPYASLVLVLLVAGCDGGGGPTTDFETPEHGLFSVNATFDYSSGTYSVVDLDDLEVLADVLPVAPDAVASCEGGRPWIIERLGWDTLTVIDSESPYGVVAQHSVGNGANPQSMLLLDGGDVLVSLLARDHLLVIDPETGQETERIDLSWAADGDGIPEASPMARAGDLVVVGLQRLDRETTTLEPSGPGWLVLVDPATRSVVDADPTTEEPDAIVLEGRNPAPYGTPTWDGDRLWIAVVGSYSTLDGGIERVDVAGRRTEGIVVGSEALGGDVNDLLLTGPHTAFATVGQPGGDDLLVRFDPATGVVDPDPLMTGDGFTLLELELSHDGRVLLVDRDLDSPGVWVLDPETGERLDRLSVGVHPFSICVL